MKKGTVRRRIFVSNTAMVLATLFLFLMVNLLVVKIYSETIEKAFLDSAEQIVNGQELEELLKQRILYQNKFLLLIAADGITCVLILVGVSRFFTRNLTIHIMEPLDALTEGAKRVQNNDLQQKIVYTGDEEFEQVCDVFNEMQHHLCEEQEKNHRYEKARTDMIAGISHDLRTPLTAIRGTIKGLLDGVASSPEMREKFLQTAYRRTGEFPGEERNPVSDHRHCACLFRFRHSRRSSNRSKGNPHLPGKIPSAGCLWNPRYDDRLVLRHRTGSNDTADAAGGNDARNVPDPGGNSWPGAGSRHADHKRKK